MPTPTCPRCRRTIASDDINVAKDVAYCRDCNQSYPLSDLTHGSATRVNVDLQHPPKGAWYTSDASGTVIGATNGSLGGVAGLLFATLFWNGIVSIFVAGALASTLHHLHVPLPDWISQPKMKGGGDMSVGMTIFLWLFLIPFITIGLYLAGTFLSTLFGRTEVRITGSQGTAFTGIGPLGWKRRFEPSQVKSVRSYETRNSNGSTTETILLETREGKPIKLGSLLTDKRRQFLLGALQKTVLK